MRWPGGNPDRSTRAVKSLTSSAAGPTTRRTSLNDSVVAYSTMNLEARSVRLQTMARSPSTSPAVTPNAEDGRAVAAVTMAGAWPKSGAAPGARPEPVEGRWRP